MGDESLPPPLVTAAAKQEEEEGGNTNPAPAINTSADVDTAMQGSNAVVSSPKQGREVDEMALQALARNARSATTDGSAFETAALVDSVDDAALLRFSMPPERKTTNVAARRESRMSMGSFVSSPSVFGRVKKLFGDANTQQQQQPATSAAAVAAAKLKTGTSPLHAEDRPPMLRNTVAKSMSFRRLRATFKTDEGAAPPMPKPGHISTKQQHALKSNTPPPPRAVTFEPSVAPSPQPISTLMHSTSSSASLTSRHSVNYARKSSSNIFGGRGERSDTGNSSKFAISKRKSGRIAMEQLSPHEQAFLPGDLLKRLGESAGQLPPAPSVFSATGAILFVDVSGFTALAEKLGKENVPVKASEKLAATITRVLQVLARVCLDGGGEVGKFCGDALLCVWESENNAKDLALAEHLAKQCAIEMLVQMENLNRLERVDLQIHGGIAKGSVVHFHFGSSDDDLRWYLMSGEAVSAATTLVDVAHAGEFCCLEGSAKNLSGIDLSQLPPRSGGNADAGTSSNVFSLTRSAEHKHPQSPMQQQQQSKKAPATTSNSASAPVSFLTSKSKLPVLPKHEQKLLEKSLQTNTAVAAVLKDGLPRHCNVYIPSALREQLNSRSVQKGEMRRRIAILFVEVSSLTMTEAELTKQTVSDAKLDSLNNAFVTMTRILHAFNGEVRDMLFDDKGCVYIGMFGAHEEEEDEAHPWQLNAVQAALAIIHEIPTARAGVSHGTCFVGMAGVIERRTDFVVVGHEVNMAARYMSNAQPGQILVSNGIMSSTKDSITYSAEMQIMVGKGKWAKQRAVYSPLLENAKREEFQNMYRLLISNASHQLVGRQAELSAMEKTMQKINTGGRSGVIAMEAPCGRGKSTLLKRVKKTGKGKVRVVSGEGILSERNTPYFPLRSVLESYTGIRPSMTPQEIKQVIEKLEGPGRGGNKINIKALALILPWIQGIAGTTGGSRAEVKPEDMADMLLKVIKLSFENGTSHQEQSALIVLDDAQWFDTPSLEILSLLVDGLEKTNRICLVLTFRTLAESELEQPFLLEEDSVEANKRRQDLVVQLRQKVRKLKFNSLWLELPCLARAESAILAEKLLGAEPTAACADALFETCKGDPSFLMYTVRYLLELKDGIVITNGKASLGSHGGVSSLPKTCDEAILKRMDELLSPDQRRVLEWAASMGGSTFDAQYIEDACKRQFPMRQIVDALQAAAELDFCTSSVMNLPGGGSTSLSTQLWDFNHDLIFRALWHALTETRRRELLSSLKEERKRLDLRVKEVAKAFATQQSSHHHHALVNH